MNAWPRRAPGFFLFLMLLPGCAPVSEPEPIATPTETTSDRTDFVAANQRWTLNLFRELKGAEGNLFLSPYDLAHNLAMLRVGAGGATADQIDQALSLSPNEGLNETFAAFDQDLSARSGATGEGFQFQTNTGLWIQQGIDPEQEYLDLLAAFYRPDVSEIDFAADPDAATRMINAWAFDRTGGRIPEAIPATAIGSQTQLVLLSTVYFKAQWLDPFDPEGTEARPFTLLNGESITVPTMVMESPSCACRFHYAALAGFQAVELLYSTGAGSFQRIGEYQDRQLSMVLLVPDEGAFTAFEAALDTDLYNEIIASLHVQDFELLTIPKFGFSNQSEMEDPFSRLGITDAFDSGAADFSGITSNPVHVEWIYHSTFVMVDEIGTEAAAATAAGLEIEAIPSPVRLAIDRPFVFVIRDTETGVILFIGRVLDPR